MLANYDHIIWDWNGTLLDDVDLSVSIINAMLHDRTMPEIDVPTYQKIFEFPVESYYRTLGFNFSIDSFTHLAAEYVGIYNAEVNKCALHDGVTELLQELSDRGKSQYILSSLEHSLLVAEIEHQNVSPYFNQLRGLADHFAAGKIDAGRALLQELSIDTARAVLVGDTLHDLEVATELGLSCILVCNGHYSKQRLDAAHHCVADSLQNLTAGVS